MCFHWPAIRSRRCSVSTVCSTRKGCDTPSLEVKPSSSPILNGSVFRGPLPVGAPLREQPLGVLEQEPVVAFEDHCHVFVVFQAEVDERSLEVQPVADHRVEVPAVVGEDPLQETLGGRHFSLAGLLKLDVQGNRSVGPFGPETETLCRGSGSIGPSWRFPPWFSFADARGRRSSEILLLLLKKLRETLL